MRIDAEYKVYDIFDMMCVKEILHRVIIGGCCNDYKLGITVCTCTVQCCRKVKFLLTEILLDIVVLNW